MADPSLQRHQEEEQKARATSAEGSLCDVSLNYQYETLSTRYNSLREVPPYAGIMFSVYSKESALEILTMELDVILENGLTDRSVEVYTKTGSYENHVHDPGVWRMVANASVVVAPGGGNNRGAIIPADDFKTVAMSPWEKRSFYVTMKDRLLDHTVNALNNRGEEYVHGKDLKLLVGAGLTEYRFPDTGLDRTVDPQFAGVLHYRTVVAAGCDGGNNETVDGSTSVTDVEYRFLPDRQISLRKIPRVNTVLDHAADDLLARSTILQRYRDSHMLRQVKNKTKTTLVRHHGSCPSDWNSCPPSVIQTTITMLHSNALSSGEVLYQMYRHAGALTSALNTDGIVSDRDGEKALGVRYVGQHSALADVQLTMTGTPAGIVMDVVQERFLADSLLRFFQEYLSDNPSISVFVVTVEGQAPLNTTERRRRMLRRMATATRRDQQKEHRRSGSIRVHGKVSGGRATHLLDKSFVDALKAAVLQDRGNRFLRWLAYDSLKPGPIAEDEGFRFFRDVTKVTAHFSVDGTGVTEEQPTKERGPNYGIIFGAVFGFLSLALGAYALHRYLQERAKYKRELEIYREERRLERRKRREEKQKLREEQEKRRKENCKRQQEASVKRRASRKPRRRPLPKPGKALEPISEEASDDARVELSEIFENEQAPAERVRSPLPRDGETRQSATDCADRDLNIGKGSSDGRRRSTSRRELRERDEEERRKDSSDGWLRSIPLRELSPRDEEQQRKGAVDSSDVRWRSTALRQLQPRNEKVPQEDLVGSDGRRRSTSLRELPRSTEEERRKGSAGSSDRRAGSSDEMRRSNSLRELWPRDEEGRLGLAGSSDGQRRSTSLRELRPRDEDERRKSAAGSSEGRRRSSSLSELRPRNEERKKDLAGSLDEIRRSLCEPRTRDEEERRKGQGGSSEGRRRSTSLPELRPRDEEERRKGLAGSSDGRSTSLRELLPRDEQVRRNGLPLVSSSDELLRSTSLSELRPHDKEDQRKGPAGSSDGRQRSTSLRELFPRDQEERQMGAVGGSDGRQSSTCLHELRPSNEEERRKGLAGSSDRRQRSASLREVRPRDEEESSQSDCHGDERRRLRSLDSGKPHQSSLRGPPPHWASPDCIDKRYPKKSNSSTNGTIGNNAGYLAIPECVDKGNSTQSDLGLRENRKSSKNGEGKPARPSRVETSNCKESVLAVRDECKSSEKREGLLSASPVLTDKGSRLDVQVNELGTSRNKGGKLASLGVRENLNSSKTGVGSPSSSGRIIKGRNFNESNLGLPDERISSKNREENLAASTTLSDTGNSKKESSLDVQGNRKSSKNKERRQCPHGKGASSVETSATEDGILKELTRFRQDFVRSGDHAKTDSAEVGERTSSFSESIVGPASGGTADAEADAKTTIVSDDSTVKEKLPPAEERLLSPAAEDISVRGGYEMPLYGGGEPPCSGEGHASLPDDHSANDGFQDSKKSDRRKVMSRDMDGQETTSEVSPDDDSFYALGDITEDTLEGIVAALEKLDPERGGKDVLVKDGGSERTKGLVSGSATSSRRNLLRKESDAWDEESFRSTRSFTSEASFRSAKSQAIDSEHHNQEKTGWTRGSSFGEARAAVREQSPGEATHQQPSPPHSSSSAPGNLLGTWFRSIGDLLLDGKEEDHGDYWRTKHSLLGSGASTVFACGDVSLSSSTVVVDEYDSPEETSRLSFAMSRFFGATRDGGTESCTRENREEEAIVFLNSNLNTVTKTNALMSCSKPQTENGQLNGEREHSSANLDRVVETTESDDESQEETPRLITNVYKAAGYGKVDKLQHRREIGNHRTRMVS